MYAKVGYLVFLRLSAISIAQTSTMPDGTTAAVGSAIAPMDVCKAIVDSAKNKVENILTLC